MQNLSRREWIAGALLTATAPAYAADAAIPASALDHVNLHVPDVNRSAEFYTKLFGLVVSRAPNAPAKPGSARGVIWFIRLGENLLAVSAAAPNEKPGIDHFCFAVTGFDGNAMKPRLAGLNQPWPDLAPANLWVKDPDGNVIQLTPGDRGAVPGAGVGAVLVEAPGGGRREPAFRATALTRLTLPVAHPGDSENYYRKLLGDTAETPKKKSFRVGHAELILGQASRGVQLYVAVAHFNPAAAIDKLRHLDIAATMARDRHSVSFRDPDGIGVEIGG